MSSPSESSANAPWWADRQLVLFVVTAVSAGVAAGATAAVTATLVPYGLAAFLGGYRSRSRRKDGSATAAAPIDGVASSLPSASTAGNTAAATTQPAPATTTNRSVAMVFVPGRNSGATAATQPTSSTGGSVRSIKPGREGSKKKSSSSSGTATGTGTAWLMNGGSGGSISTAGAVSVLAGKEGVALRDAVMSGMVMPESIAVTRETFPYHLRYVNVLQCAVALWEWEQTLPEILQIPQTTNPPFLCFMSFIRGRQGSLLMTLEEHGSRQDLHTVHLVQYTSLRAVQAWVSRTIN